MRYRGGYGQVQWDGVQGGVQGCTRVHKEARGGGEAAREACSAEHDLIINI